VLIGQLVVVERGNQVEPQAEALAAVTVALGQDAEDLQAADDVLDHEPFAGELPVRPLLLIRERVMLALLLRQTAVAVALRQAQIPAVRQALGLWQERQTGPQEQLEVVRPARAEARHEDALCLRVGDDLRFLGVALLLTAVTLSLFFFGRSTGHSVASTTTTSKAMSVLVSAFLPGRVNRPERISAPSTVWMVRQTADSLSP
jgi:hypothetical protein